MWWEETTCSCRYIGLEERSVMNAGDSLQELTKAEQVRAGKKAISKAVAGDGAGWIPYVHGSWEWQGWENHRKTIPGPGPPEGRGRCETQPLPSLQKLMSTTRAPLGCLGASGASSRGQATDSNVPTWPSQRRGDGESVRDEPCCLADSAGWRESHCSPSYFLWFPFVLPGANLLFSVLQADGPRATF